MKGLINMYNGELANHSYEYQCGHESGSIRAYDDAIGYFMIVQRNEKRGVKYSSDEIIAMLKMSKEIWLRHCDEYGMANDDSQDMI